MAMMSRAKIIGTATLCRSASYPTMNWKSSSIPATSITRRTGIKERRISSKGRRETATDLAAQAALKAVEMAGISAAELDMIVVGTVTPDRQFPSTGCMVQTAIGASHAPAFDVSAGCSGFLYALTMAHNAVRAQTSRLVLVLGVERLSTIINWQDQSTSVSSGTAPVPWWWRHPKTGGASCRHTSNPMEQYGICFTPPMNVPACLNPLSASISSPSS